MESYNSSQASDTMAGMALLHEIDPASDMVVITRKIVYGRTRRIRPQGAVLLGYRIPFLLSTFGSACHTPQLLR